MSKWHFRFWVSSLPISWTCNQLSSLPVNSISTKQSLYIKFTLRCKTIQVHISVLHPWQLKGETCYTHWRYCMMNSKSSQNFLGSLCMARMSRREWSQLAIISCTNSVITISWTSHPSPYCLYWHLQPHFHCNLLSPTPTLQCLRETTTLSLLFTEPCPLLHCLYWATHTHIPSSMRLNSVPSPSSANTTQSLSDMSGRSGGGKKACIHHHVNITHSRM